MAASFPMEYRANGVPVVMLQSQGKTLEYNVLGLHVQRVLPLGRLPGVRLAPRLPSGQTHDGNQTTTAFV